mgnify:CR=1 FL=1|jgi:hypothetical protein
MDFDRVEFVCERNKALCSLNEEKILSFCRKYGVYHPHSDLEFWKSVHEARISIKDIPESAKEVSRKWLSSHGFQSSEAVQPPKSEGKESSEDAGLHK